MTTRQHIAFQAVTLLLFLSAFRLQLVAQEQAAIPENFFRVQGVVLDSASRQSVPYATIEVYNQNIASSGRTDTLRQVTDDAGHFEIAVPPAQRYVFSARFVGMKPILQVFTEKELRSKELLRLYMNEDAEQLGEVTITAQKPLVRLGVDRIAYNVKDDPTSKTENLRDMLRRVPLVTVDGEGNIQVKGSGNYRIFLNGKPSTMISSNPKEVLRAIPASTVKKIEVITNPGVEYDAEGASAILNIVTETGTDMKGVMGTISAGGGIPKMGMASTNLTIALGKVSITAGYNYFANNRSYNSTEQNNTVERWTANTFSRTESDVHKFRGSNKMFNFGLTYEINPKHLLSTAFSYSRMAKAPIETTNITSFYPASGDQGAKMLMQEKVELKQQYRNNTLEARADYQISTNNEGEMLTLSYLYAHNPENSYTETERRLEGEGLHGELQQQHTRNNANLDEHTAQIDYVRPFGEMHKLIVGGKYIARLGKANPFYEVFSPVRNAWIPGSIYGQDKGLGGSNMNYHQDLFSAYAGYLFMLNKFSLNTGLRIETGSYKVDYDKLDDADFRHGFTDFVPQLSLAYNFSQVLQLKLAYNMRVRRPSIAQLNPYRNQTNISMVEYGNAHLSNERVHNFDLAVSSYSQKLTFQASFIGEYINHPIASIAFADSDRPDLINTTFGNIGYSYAAGVNGFINYRPISWLQLLANANIRYSVLDAGETTHALDGKPFLQHNRGWNGTTFFMTSFTLPKAWTITGYVGTYSIVPTIFISPVNVSFHGFSISKGFLGGKLNVALSASNPFTPHYRTELKGKGPGFEENITNRSSFSQVTLNISYTFGELKTATKKVSRTIKNEDLSTVSSSSIEGGGAQGGEQGK